MGKLQNPSELRIQHSKPFFSFPPPKINADGEAEEPQPQILAPGFTHFRGRAGLKSHRSALPFFVLDPKYPTVMQGGVINSCNEWLIASGRPGGRRYFQLRWIPMCQTGGKKMALGGLGGEWGPQPCSSSARPQRFLNDKGQEEQPPNPPAPNPPPRVGEGGRMSTVSHMASRRVIFFQSFGASCRPPELRGLIWREAEGPHEVWGGEGEELPPSGRVCSSLSSFCL